MMVTATIVGATNPFEKFRAEKEPAIRDNKSLQKLFKDFSCPTRDSYLLPTEGDFWAKIAKNSARIKTQAAGRSLTLPSGPLDPSEIDVEMQLLHTPTSACASLASARNKVNGDAFTSFSLEAQFQGSLCQVDFFAVLDGHGIGSKNANFVSNFCKRQLKDAVNQCMLELNKEGHPHTFANALTITFSLLDSRLKKEGCAIEAGTTLCLAAIVKEKGYLFIANCGDSRAVLGKGAASGFQELSYDYSVDREEARKTVLSRGGVLKKIKEEWYVTGKTVGIRMSRALGDFDLESTAGIKAISCRPKCMAIKLDPNLLERDSACLFLGTDGVFKPLGSRACAEYACNLLAKQQSPAIITRSVVQIGRDKSSDDTTAFVISLRPYLQKE